VSIVFDVAMEIRDEVNARGGKSDFVFYVNKNRYKAITDELRSRRDKSGVLVGEKPIKGVIISGINVQEEI
jgi:hypothetical protein